MGFLEASVWVLDVNERARRFYEATGWRLEDRTHARHLAGVELTEIRYRKVLV
jgi:hypothetical protein